MSRKRQASDDRYDDKDLLGIKVSHSESLFKEGQDVILTLKDANVLDTEEDVLENVNLVDIEKSNRNIENKSSRPEYNPFDEPEYDSLGRYKKKTLLSKYDEEINGLKKESFRIGLDESRRLEQLEEIKKAISKEKGEVSLNVPKYKIASEYYTEEEIVSFKKPAKKSKKSTKKSNKQDSKPITADSLLPLGNENTDDHGNRNNINNNFGNKLSNRKVAEVIDDEDDIVDEAFLEHQNLLQNVIKSKIKTKESTSTKKSSDTKHQNKSNNHKSSSSNRSKTNKNESVEIKKERPNLSDEEANKADDSDEDDYAIPDDEIFGMALEEDDLQRDLMKSLDKARKLKQKERLVESELEKITETVLLLNEDEIKAESSRSIVFEERNDRVINSTAEFCRNLGGDSNNLKYGKEEEELLDFERDLLEEKEERMDVDDEDENGFKSMRNKWSEVDFKTEQPKTVDLSDSKAVILEEEPDVSCGLAGALKLAMKKGYLDKEIKKSNVSVKASSLEAKNYTIEEKFYEDDKFSRRERYNGSLMEFKEKSNYKPDVKLEYNDDNGRQLNSKEAFRVLSHKFHGKGPGKNKIDKRLKKINQETKLKLMTSSDTPLSTTKLLIEKQKELHTPYVVLSANQNILSKKPQ